MTEPVRYSRALATSLKNVVHLAKSALAAPLEHRDVAPWLLLLPALLILLFVFVGPLLYMGAYSLMRYHPTRLVIPKFTLENYADLISDVYVRSLLVRTLRVTVLATLFTLVVGYPLAYHMNRVQGLERSLLSLILLSPMTLSVVILGYAWLVILAPNTGLVTWVFQRIGMSGSPIRLMFSEAGIIVALVHANLVFMVLNLNAALKSIDPEQIRAAKILGASPFQAFYKVTLPLSLTGVFSGSMLVFATTSSSLMIPLMIGGRQVPVFATSVYDLNSAALNWPASAAAGFVLLVITTGSVFLYASWIARVRGRLGMT